MLTGGLRDAALGGPGARARARRAPGAARRLAELAEAARCLAADADATDTAARPRRRRSRSPSEPQLPERLLDLSGLRRPRASGRRATRTRAKAVEQAALDELARATASCCRSCSIGSRPSTRRRRSASRRSTSRISSSSRATCSATTTRSGRRSSCASARSWSTSSRTRTGSSASSSTSSRGPDTERFFVGDEFQSIYGFRHADVDVFRERRAAAETLLPLTRNYRSRPEVLAAVNHLFGAEFGERLPAARGLGRVPRSGVRASRRAARHRQGGYAGSGLALARGRRRATSPGASASSSTRVPRAPGEIVLLFAAGTDAEWYEEELREAGLPTYRATGRGYFGQQQVVDLLSYLRLLHNRYDDEALADRARLAVRRRLERRAGARPAPRRRGPLFTGLERGAAGGSRRRRRAPAPRVQAALRPARRRRRRGSRSSGCASGSSPSTTTTSPCSPGGTAAAATRTCAS